MINQHGMSMMRVLTRSGLRDRASGWHAQRPAIPLTQLYIPVQGDIILNQRQQRINADVGTVTALAPWLDWQVRCPGPARYLHLRVLAQYADGADLLPLSALPMRAPLSASSTAVLPQLCAAFTAWDHGELAASIRFQAMAALIMADVVASLPAMDQAPRDWLRPALELLALSLDDPDLRVEDLAAACNCSADWFTRRCRSSLGIAPKRLMLQRRLERACLLLGSQPDWSVAAVGRACGFRQSQHFITAFTRHCGCSPGRWRRAAS